ncbi:MAG: hypothetical protein IJZ79_07260 [Bacilli bacterium]|nr:hypothetical protein [Bacilli bacterium]
MDPRRYFIPNMPNMRMNMGINNIPIMRMNYMNSRRIGLFGKISNNIKTFNWSNLLNGANKTLNVMNQTIPLIRQTRPMINNMKSMLKLAKVFRNETFSKRNNNPIINNINTSTKKNDINNKVNNTSLSSNYNNNYPTFFI